MTGLREGILPLYSALVRPPLAVLYPVLGSSTLEGHGVARANLEEATKNDQGTGVPLLWRQDERAILVQLGEEKAPAPAST